MVVATDTVDVVTDTVDVVTDTVDVAFNELKTAKSPHFCEKKASCFI